MRFFCFLISILFCLTETYAHPGVGIAVDSKGNLFYTDLENVWKISPDGTKTIAVANVHTHDLYIDSKDQLFGEHLWYNGEQLNTWGYYLWCRLADGNILNVKDSTQGYPKGYSFTRDEFGNMYYLEQTIPSTFWKVDKEGNKHLIGTKLFSVFGRLHISKKGALYFSDNDELYCIPPGDSIQLVLKDIGEKALWSNNDQLSIMNIWSDKKENIYVATGNVIKLIDSKKVITTIYKSSSGWNPASGLIADNGDFWVMEYNLKNEVRVNKISIEKRKEIVKEHVFFLYAIPVLIIIGLLSFLYFIFKPK